MLCFVASAEAARGRNGIQAMRKSIVLGLAAALAMLAGAVANAEVQVSGTADQLMLRTKDATLAEVLAGLATTSHPRIDVTGATTRQFTGIYSGSLREVLSRLLAGVDHVMRIAPDGMTIVIVGPPVPGGARTFVVAARIDDGGLGVQGWVPSGPAPGAITAPAQPASRAAAADTAEPASGVQGWVPVASITATPEAPAAPGGPIANDKAEAAPAGIQGWVPTPIAAATPPASVGSVAPDRGILQTQPITSENDATSGVQGWIPSAVRVN
jgi:hypothetical protein